MATRGEGRIVLVGVHQSQVVGYGRARLRTKNDVSGFRTGPHLHKLLNEMDGLRPDAQILFILTMNRPEALETALASRPGRVDQAIEFPLPDEAGRDKLIRLYARGLSIADDLVQTTVRRTDSVSASFIKELMRRSAQFMFERDGSQSALSSEDIENALEELPFVGGKLNRRVLGAHGDGFDGES